MEEKKDHDELKDATEQINDAIEAAPTPKPTNWKGILALILVMAIGYGTGFGTLALANWLNSRNESSTECTECHDCEDDEELDVDTENIVEVKKPIIYLYPTSTTTVTVELGNPELITCSYPEYINSWTVTANPDGTLMHEGQDLYALYYESELNKQISTKRTGFVVKGAETAKFLEEKLTILGLNYKERQEFIMYWLPKMQENNYNYLYFATGEEVEEQMPLNIYPAPDTTIRVWMYYEKLDIPFTANEQDLVAVERTGFTVVEWGGTEINNFRPKLLRTGPIIRIPPYSPNKNLN